MRSLPELVGNRDETDPTKIVNGTAALAGEIPWMVALTRGRNDKPPESSFVEAHSSILTGYYLPLTALSGESQLNFIWLNIIKSFQNVGT